jgi:hypothetical protein
VLNSCGVHNGTVELVQRRIGRSTSQLRHSKGSIVISLILLLGAVSVVAIVGSFVVTARDGYRRQPREAFALTV